MDAPREGADRPTLHEREMVSREVFSKTSITIQTHTTSALEEESAIRNGKTI